MQKETLKHTTAAYLYDRIALLLRPASLFSDERWLSVRHTLRQACALTESRGLASHADLCAVIDRVSCDAGLSQSAIAQLHAMRRASEDMSDVDEGVYRRHLRSLARWVALCTGEPIPRVLDVALPDDACAVSAPEDWSSPTVTCTVTSHQEGCVSVMPDDKAWAGREYALQWDAETFGLQQRALKKGDRLCLLDVEIKAQTIVAQMVILDPDYLIDISSLAACFTAYGSSPYLYLLKQWQGQSPNRHMLMGWLAGVILDEVVRGKVDHDWKAALDIDFREHAPEYCSCLKDVLSDSFAQEAQRQEKNIKEAFAGIVNENGTHGKEFILEPTFISDKLGLKGRVDLMSLDMKWLVEQKAGINRHLAQGTPNRYGGMHLESHQVQLLLYGEVLRRHLGLNEWETQTALLYSKYPPEEGLLRVKADRSILRKALALRNRIVFLEQYIADQGIRRVLPLLNMRAIYPQAEDNGYFKSYLQAPVERLLRPLLQLKGVEKDYFEAMTDFVYREQWYAKTGANSISGHAASDLWKCTLMEKEELGNICRGLKIEQTEVDVTDGSELRVTFKMNMEQDKAVNFRNGDRVYLYQDTKRIGDNVTNNILYKATVAEVDTTHVTLAIRHAPKGLLADKTSIWQIEHTDNLSTANTTLRGIVSFISGTHKWKDVLLSVRRPTKTVFRKLSQSYDDGYDEIIRQALQADDYFVLVGPPGTGKTSRAMKYIVSEHLKHLQNPANPRYDQHHAPAPAILLMAYTNRAVDEIAEMLTDASIDYLRIGSPHNCAQRHRSHLLSYRIKSIDDTKDVECTFNACDVFIGTTSTIMSHPSIFGLRSFALAVIDEASQIPEPDLLGLFAPRSEAPNTPLIEKFILIGDHKQLPAIVLQPQAESLIKSTSLTQMALTDCRNSLFKRLIEMENRAGSHDFISILSTYGRLHPDLAEFPHHMFYAQAGLRPVPCPHQVGKDIGYVCLPHNPLQVFLQEHRLIYLPSPEVCQKYTSEKTNHSEACMTARLLHEIVAMYGTNFDAGSTLGIIVPYRHQIALIRKMAGKIVSSQILNRITIDTVERFQGSQRDIIIYDFTIKNQGQIDFLTESRFTENGSLIDPKLNVALTRARKQIIIIGNQKLLFKDPIYRQLIESIRRANGVVDEKMLSQWGFQHLHECEKRT